MGGRSSRVSIDQWDINQLQQATGLPYDQIQQIQTEFYQSAGRDGLMDMREFANLCARFPGVAQQPNFNQQVQRVFQTFDRDRTGKLSFDEFLDAVIMMNHNMPRIDRVDYLIRQNNAYGRQQGNGHISSQYGHQVFRRLNDYYGLPPGTEHQCWKQVDQQHRGYVTQDELMNYIRQQEAYNRRYQ